LVARKWVAIEIQRSVNFLRDKFWYLHNQSADESEKEMEETRFIEELEYKVTSIITVWLLKNVVVNFADFGEIWGVALACGIR
jgi:hypothetical protein